MGEKVLINFCTTTILHYFVLAKNSGIKDFVRKKKYCT